MKKRLSRSYQALAVLAIVAVLVSACTEIPMVVTGDLTLAQYGGRTLASAVGAGLSWGASLFATPIGGIIVAIAYETEAKPLIYDRFDLWPKSQSVGPAEPLPW